MFWVMLFFQTKHNIAHLYSTMEITTITTTLELLEGSARLRGNYGTGKRILMSNQDRADIMIWLPIVVLLILIAIFFAVLGIRYQIWQHTPHPLVKEDATEKDGESAEETKHAPERAPEATHKTTLIHTKRLPDDLVRILIEQQLHPGHRELLSHHRHILNSIVRRYSNSQMKSDVEALEMFSLLPGLLESGSAMLAASSLKDRGFPGAALRLLVDDTDQEGMELKTSLEAIQREEWKHAHGKMMLHYGKFWKGYELRAAVATCFRALKERVHSVSSNSNHERHAKFGIDGMVRDCHGPFTEEEQSKSKIIFTALNEDGQSLAKIIDALDVDNLSVDTGLFQKRIFPGHSCKLPFVRFVKVEAVLKMDILTRFENMPHDAFIKQGKFAVSFGWSSEEQADAFGNKLKRLQHILQNLEGVRPDDGVYIDRCCFEINDPMKTLVSKSIFQHCHVIILPDKDYFVRPRCVYEYCTWLQSPFPNQAVSDYDLVPAANQLAAYFGRPPYLLDRPQLQFFGYRCMASTEGHDDENFFLSTKLVNESQVQQCSLEELLTKLIFKLESFVIV